jgi:hypothetical protein
VSQNHQSSFETYDVTCAAKFKYIINTCKVAPFQNFIKTAGGREAKDINHEPGLKNSLANDKIWRSVNTDSDITVAMSHKV